MGRFGNTPNTVSSSWKMFSPVRKRSKIKFTPSPSQNTPNFKQLLNKNQKLNKKAENSHRKLKCKIRGLSRRVLMNLKTALMNLLKDLIINRKQRSSPKKPIKEQVMDLRPINLRKISQKSKM